MTLAFFCQKTPFFSIVPEAALFVLGQSGRFNCPQKIHWIPHIQRLSVHNWYNQSIRVLTNNSFKLQSSHTNNNFKSHQNHTLLQISTTNNMIQSNTHTNYSSFKQKDKYSSHWRLHTYKQCSITGTYTELKYIRLKLYYTQRLFIQITLKCLIQRHTHIHKNAH